MQKKIAEDTVKVLQSYLTYQAVRIIIDQLGETNPGKGIWLRQYASGNRVQDGEQFLQELMAEHKELVLRIMTVREHLAESVLDLLPAMVRSSIVQSNLEHRRQLLERLTQAQPEASPSESASAELDSNESSDR
ncbi:MAG: RbcX chaperonin protein [Chloroflexaceae bacterium]|nr:RbcX chaperonin protein [Chloroflexaceae bacterium]